MGVVDRLYQISSDCGMPLGEVLAVWMIAFFFVGVIFGVYLRIAYGVLYRLIRFIKRLLGRWLWR